MYDMYPYYRMVYYKRCTTRLITFKAKTLLTYEMHNKNVLVFFVFIVRSIRNDTVLNIEHATYDADGKQRQGSRGRY